MASSVQEYAGLPSTSTVHAPQVARSQTFLAPVVVELVAQRVNQGDARLDSQVDALAVDVQRDRNRIRSQDLVVVGAGLLRRTDDTNGTGSDADALNERAARKALARFAIRACAKARRVGC